MPSVSYFSCSLLVVYSRSSSCPVTTLLSAKCEISVLLLIGRPVSLHFLFQF
jgi:hypothetical protein